MKMIIKGGRVINPADNTDEVRDLYIKDGIITSMFDITDDTEVINAENLIVAPGLVDLHVHFRDPGYEYKEDIETGSRAAAAGGVTTVVCMPNTNPVIDNKALVKYVINRGKEVGLTNVLTTGCVSKGQKSEELSEIGEISSAGAVAITDDGKPVMTSSLMRKALEYAKMFNMPVFSHSEDLSLVDGGSMNEGFMSTYLGLRGIPKAAESVAVARDVLIAEEVGARLHICHVSTKNSVDIIRQAKRRGVNVTCETAPHYFSLTEKAVDGFNTNAKMNPPLRDEEDVLAITEALKDGTIDAIATDHAPHHIDEKECEFDIALNGIVGLETSLAVGITYLVREKKLTYTQLIEKMSKIPAEIININRGTLNDGVVADIVIFDPEEKWTVDKNKLNSRSKNTPYDGMELYGVVKKTILNGKVVYKG